MVVEDKPQIIVVLDKAALAARAAEVIIEAGQEATASRGRYMLALSGGATPVPVFQELASRRLRNELDWSRVHTFWTDERCVSPDHHDSNYGLAREMLLQHVPVRHIYRLAGEAANPSEAARDYQRIILEAFGLSGGELPRFDLMLLGIGTDGHVASLFPGSDAVKERKALVVTPFVPHLSCHRISLTLPVLNHTRCCLFIASGERKRPILRRVLRATAGDETLPASLVRPQDGKVIWVVDQAVYGSVEK